jgi:hypothetical protein
LEVEDIRNKISTHSLDGQRNLKLVRCYSTHPSGASHVRYLLQTVKPDAC